MLVQYLFLGWTIHHLAILLVSAHFFHSIPGVLCVWKHHTRLKAVAKQPVVVQLCLTAVYAHIPGDDCEPGVALHEVLHLWPSVR